LGSRSSAAQDVKDETGRLAIDKSIDPHTSPSAKFDLDQAEFLRWALRQSPAPRMEEHHYQPALGGANQTERPAPHRSGAQPRQPLHRALDSLPSFLRAPFPGTNAGVFIAVVIR